MNSKWGMASPSWDSLIKSMIMEGFNFLNKLAVKDSPTVYYKLFYCKKMQLEILVQSDKGKLKKDFWIFGGNLRKTYLAWMKKKNELGSIRLFLYKMQWSFAMTSHSYCFHPTLEIVWQFLKWSNYEIKRKS